MVGYIGLVVGPPTSAPSRGLFHSLSGGDELHLVGDLGQGAVHAGQGDAAGQGVTGSEDPVSGVRSPGSLFWRSSRRRHWRPRDWRMPRMRAVGRQADLGMVRARSGGGPSFAIRARQASGARCLGRVRSAPVARRVGGGGTAGWSPGPSPGWSPPVQRPCSRSGPASPRVRSRGSPPGWRGAGPARTRRRR